MMHDKPTHGQFLISDHVGDFECFYLPKGNGRYRKIYSVDDVSKKILLEHLPYLHRIMKDLDLYSVNHGFLPGRNPASNALQHVGYQYTLSIDLEDFFPSVTRDHLTGLVNEDVLRDCFALGSARQGLPTSPMIANIALTKFDNRIIRVLKSIGVKFVYTRYADDLSFSFDDRKLYPKVKVLVEQVINDLGFSINNKKTKLQSSKNGRIIITGIGVDEHGIFPTRKVKKKLRAAVHQGNLRSTRGLREWSKCKLPKVMVT